MAREEQVASDISAAVDPSSTSWYQTRQSVTFLVRSDVKKQLEKGKQAFDKKDLPNARAAYEKALELDPSCAIAYFYLGFTHHEAGNYEAAKDSYLQAIDLDKRQALFLEHLARLHFELQEYSVCLVRFQEAQAVGSLQPISYGLMGRANYEMERFPEAIDCFERMLDVEKDSHLLRVARYYLILSYIKNQSIMPARSHVLAMLSEEECEDSLLSSLSEKFEAVGCLSLAIVILEKIQNPSLEALERKGLIKQNIAQAEKFIPHMFTADEEKVLHNIHYMSQFGTDRIYRLCLSLMEMPSILIKESIISYCRKFGYEISQSALIECFEGPPILQQASLGYLADTLDPDYLPLLIQHIDSPAREIQAAIGKYLESCGKMEHLPILEAHLDSADGPVLRRQFQRAIKQIKRRHTEQTHKLINREVQLAKSSSPEHSKSGVRVAGLLGVSLAALLAVYSYFML